MRQPTLYIPHGGGPCFFMEWTMGPKNTWDRMAEMLKKLSLESPEKPKALLVVSAHWEEDVTTVMTSPSPPLFYDYYGFPPNTYELKWPALGSQSAAKRVRELLSNANIESGEDSTRGFDHGVFIPLLLAYPNGEIPTVQLSLRKGLDAKTHFEIGKALAPLRDEGVLIIGSGMSFHNLRAYGSSQTLGPAQRFDASLTEAIQSDDFNKRKESLFAWQNMSDAIYCHPRSEHLTPLFVCAGAASEEPGKKIFSDVVMNATTSAFRFG